MHFELKPCNRNVSEEELLGDLRRVAEMFPNQPMTHWLYNHHGRFNSATLHYRFGGWHHALERVGLQRSRPYRTPVEDLFANLENVWRQLGRQPRIFDLKSPLSKYSGSTYARRFPSFQMALRAFVESVNARDDGEDQATMVRPQQTVPATSDAREIPRNPGWRMRFLTLHRDNFRCRACGRSPTSEPGVKLHVDHIVPWSRGGQTVLENLQTLCQQCNGGKSDLPCDEKKAGD
jgi:HNH endonuclease/Homing endonuclease associated repeat